MKKLFTKIVAFFDNRSLILSLITIAVGIIYVGQLVNLQIVNGKEYREQSEKKMLRNETIEAPRGEIYDRNGVILAENKLSFDLEIFKVKIDEATQNDIISKIIDILDSNSDKINSTFPISEDLKSFDFVSQDDEKKFKTSNGLDQNATLDSTIDYFINRYNLKNYDRTKAIKIIQIKYQANADSYSLFNPSVIAKNISQKSVAEIEEAKGELLGVKTISVPMRYYPYGELAAQTIGYVSKISSDEYSKLKEQNYSYNSIIGKAGIEQTFEKYLKGTDGVNRVEVDSQGTVNSETVTQQPVSGNNITLTIDYRLQQVAEDSLKNTINAIATGGSNIWQKYPDANAGAVVVLDTVTGEVLASASYPSYDPNKFVNGISTSDWNAIANNPLHPMVNRVISGIYSPGSTFKMLVALAGLTTGVITTTEQILDKGIYPYAHHPKCWIFEERGTTHGLVDVAKAIKVSCNYFFYEVGRRLGIDKIVEYAKMFGLGQKTGIEVSNEATGSISGDGVDPKDWNLGLTLSSAIGQAGNSYTPIQLANYISAFANGGNLNKVTLIKNVADSSQKEISQDEINNYVKSYTGVDFQPKKLNVNETYVDAIKQGMLSVTSDVGGTSYIVFKNSDIQVAGKTGTAQRTEGSNDGIFVGFAPYDNPRIAVFAVIEHGGEGTYVANVVKPIMEEYFNIVKQDQNSDKTQNISKKNVEY